jgi:NADH dehydrogenase FAD-containing subunit
VAVTSGLRGGCREIVLLGAGHTHPHVLRDWRSYAGARLTCVSQFETATYSGMLPAVLAGQQPVAAMEIALAPLCGASGATLIIDDIAGVAVRGRGLVLSGGRVIPFDILSIGVGSVPCRGFVRHAWASPGSRGASFA